MVFEINAKQLFLTYPQCPATKEDALHYLLALFGGIEAVDKYVVAHEHHQNGDDHLHVYLKLKEPYRSRSANCFDLISPDGSEVFHGNYQGCRSAKNVVKYCTKKDDYISNFDVSELVDKSTGMKKLVAKKLVLEKRELTEVVLDHPELLFGYTRLKIDLNTLKEDIGPQKEDLPDLLPNPWGRLLYSNLQTKRRHYWIFSRQPNKGKTFHFALPLKNKYRTVIATGDFQYWNVDSHTQLLILDDYNSAKLKWDAINQLCDGTYQFRVAYRGVVTVAKYLVVILSNQPISELYPFMNQFLYERFEEVEIV